LSRIFDVAVIVGSLRKESYNRKMAHALIKLAPPSLKPEIVEIGALALYNEDDEARQFPAWKEFRDRIGKAEAFLFVTPEYNRSMPGVLKNALDVASRPYGQSKWDGKPGAIVSVSPGAIGGFGANHHLRQSLVFLNVPSMQQPEAYINGAAHLFEANGDFAKNDTREFMQKFMNAFAMWVDTNARRE